MYAVKAVDMSAILRCSNLSLELVQADGTRLGAFTAGVARAAAGVCSIHVTDYHHIQ